MICLLDPRLKLVTVHHVSTSQQLYTVKIKPCALLNSRVWFLETMDVEPYSQDPNVIYGAFTHSSMIETIKHLQIYSMLVEYEHAAYQYRDHVPMLE